MNNKHIIGIAVLALLSIMFLINKYVEDKPRIEQKQPTKVETIDIKPQKPCYTEVGNKLIEVDCKG